MPNLSIIHRSTESFWPKGVLFSIFTIKSIISPPKSYNLLWTSLVHSLDIFTTSLLPPLIFPTILKTGIEGKRFCVFCDKRIIYCRLIWGKLFLRTAASNRSYLISSSGRVSWYRLEELRGYDEPNVCYLYALNELHLKHEIIQQSM